MSASHSSKRETTESGYFYFIFKRSQMHANCPLKDIACMLLGQTTNSEIVCHRVSNNDDMDAHIL